MLTGLGRVWKRVGELAAIDPRFAPLPRAARGDQGAARRPRVRPCAIIGDSIDASPGRLEQVEERLALLERLKRKHGPTLDDVIARRDALAAEHAALTGGGVDGRGRRGSSSATRRRRFSTRRARCRRLAARQPREVRHARSKRELADLAMERTRFEVRLDDRRGRAQLVGARHRRRGVLPVAQPRRGPAAAGAHRVGRRAVARDAGAQDAGRSRPRRARR